MGSAPSLNLARYDFLSVRIALACAQHGSLSAAAASCNLALAAASRRVRELEQSLGAPLFERHRRGLIVTPSGQVFVKHALALLQTVERLGDEMRDLQQGVARHVSLAASTAAINEFLPPLLSGYARRRPDVRVELLEQVSHAVPGMVREGRSDVGIFVEGPDAAGLHTQLFREDELVLVLHRTHRFGKGRGALAFADLLGEEWIGLTEGAALLEAQQKAALAANRPLRMRFQVRSFDAVCHLVRSGLGIAVLPRAAAEPIARTMGLSVRPLADAWARRRLLLATRAAPQDEAVVGLAAFLCEPSRSAKPKLRNRQ